ncbi:site-specific integrase [Gillisia sp. CAL575]|uniref:site-specific integrase n=1 Tax=Gillisia sp. CAL575 TaxID=985255 RepID=UPI00039D59F0|nr:site-specific integrase [Gillisia sp. CAL575]
MKAKFTFSILFWINSSRAKENLADLFVRITVNGKRVNLSLKEKVLCDQWDSQKSKVRGSNSQAQRINHYLETTRNEIFQSYVELKSSSNIITAQAIKERYLGEDVDYPTLKELIDYHNEQTKHILHYDTQRHYKTSQKYILEYVKKQYKSDDYILRDLNYGFIIGFENFLRSYKPRHPQSSIGNNTIMKHIQRLRKMVTMAFHIEWLDRDPFVKFKTKLIKTDRDFLSKEELKKIEEFSSPLERLNLTKDLFIFISYTGISYGDIMQLSKRNIVKGQDQNLWIYTKRKKTSTHIKIPLLQKALEIVKKYENLEFELNGKLLPKLSNQKMNTYLKEISQLCEIDKNLTSHVARHTFATTITLSNGVPIETVSKLLGHTKMATTQIYARVIEKKVSDDMNTLRAKFQEEIN